MCRGPIRQRLILVVFLLSTFPAYPARAQTSGPDDSRPLLPAVADIDPTVPTTERVLGYSLGDRMTDFSAMQSYMQALSRDPGRVFQRTYGKTHEGRALRYLVISHPDNMARLEEIRAASVRLSDPRGLTAAAAEQIIRSNPVIVWLAYSVHGDEHSSTEAALAAAYQLAASRDEATSRMLHEVVVIIDPLQNPDGRERFLTYERQVAGPEPKTDPMAAEHDPPWPGGRYNHYLFDLNRDWFFQTQPETQGRVAAFQEWMPQVYVDLHEMASNATYYFAPPSEPINRNIPGSTRKWWSVFGKANADAFDRAGFEYYTGESFDDYYPGYGDSWPTLQGAIGMTYEQASPRGMAIEREDGSRLTLKEAARHHLTSSLATVRTAASNREALLRDYYGFRKEAIAVGGTGPTRAFIIPATIPATALKLAALLSAQGVEVRRADEEFSAHAFSYDGTASKTRRFPAGTLFVDLGQPAGRLATALMEMDPSLDDRFIAQELERRRLKEDSGIYDVTSWSLPIVAGAEACWTPDSLHVRSTRVTAESLKSVPGVRTLGPAAPPYAYLLKYDSNAAAMAMVSLMNLSDPNRTGLRLQIAGRPFRIGEEAFTAGSVILKVGSNPASLARIVEKEAATFGVTFYAVSSGLTDSGPDLGSNSVVTLKMPRVAVAYGDPVAPSSVGSICHMFESIYGLPYTPIRPSSLPDADLSRYNVIILPDASASPGYVEYFGAGGLRKLKTWIEGGGTLVTLKRASSFAAGKDVGLTTARRLFKPRARPTGGSDENTPATGGDASAETNQLPDTVPGAILRVAIEPTQYLGFGYGAEGAVMVNSNLAFSPSKEGRNVVTFSSRERLRLAGFAWQESIDLLAGTAYLVEEPRGRGRVILFADDPNFRGYWESLNRMFLNSVVFSPSFGGVEQ
ncbi:MAG TPA: M14 family metallopeptidase [Patescibacteria group bacterium]|nr:M14 family metallopeptidase [Patescibacteria group bacterium]